MEYPKDFVNKIICGDCLEVLRDIPRVDLIITDPPYPDYYAEKYGYKEGMIDFLKDIPCRQLIFWSAKVDFPLDYTAIHIWNKQRGIGSEYERIFERNGQKNYKLFTDFSMDSYRAKITHEGWTGHPSQKPLRLMKKLINHFSKSKDIILDPFVGSGTTLVASKEMGHQFIGIEISPDYCKIAEQRLAQEMLF